MPRPKKKSELLNASSEAFGQLTELLEQFSATQLKGTFPFSHRDRCIRDVLAHLHEWHLLFLDWYAIGMDGGKPAMPAEGYSWKTTPELNEAIRQKVQRISLKKVRSNLEQTHDQLQKLILSHTNVELFEKRRYAWTGSTSLGSYLTSATSAHYNWAIKLLRKYQRAC